MDKLLYKIRNKYFLGTLDWVRNNVNLCKVKYEKGGIYIWEN